MPQGSFPSTRYGHWITFFFGEMSLAGDINWGLRGELSLVCGVALGRTFTSGFSGAAATICTLSAAGGRFVDFHSTAGERSTRECELRRRVCTVPESCVTTCCSTGAKLDDSGCGAGVVSTGGAAVSTILFSLSTLTAAVGGSSFGAAVSSLRPCTPRNTNTPTMHAPISPVAVAMRSDSLIDCKRATNAERALNLGGSSWTKSQISDRQRHTPLS